MKQIYRECLAYIAVNHQTGTFTCNDIPESFRAALRGMKLAGHVVTRFSKGSNHKIFKVTQYGLTQAKQTSKPEMEKYTK